MTAQKNPEIGRVACFTCDTDSSVRRDRGQRLYYSCPECGVVNPKGPGFQSRMESAVVLHADETPTEQPEVKPDADPEPKPEPTPARPAKGGAFKSVTDWLNSEV